MGTTKLLVIWSSEDREVALKTAFMYTYNAKVNGWWDHIQLCVWGPSAKMLLRDYVLKNEIMKIRDAGVELTACKACTDQYGLTAALENLGIDVKYMGIPLTEMLKDGWAVLTY